MACMYNSEHHQNCSLMGPRISFSNDFVIDSSGPSIKHERPMYRPELDPSASDFEFSSSGNHHQPMIAADEVFFKGRLMPLKENCARLQKMTLRDELQNGDEEGTGGGGGRRGRGGYAAAAAANTRTSSSKVPIRWKELLGLRKAPPVPKKHDKPLPDGSTVQRENELHGKSSQESRSDGRYRNMEVGI